MSSQDTSRKAERSPKPGIQVLPRSEFICRHIAALEVTAKGGPAFKFAVLPHAKGTDLVLEDSTGALFMCHTDLQFDFGNEPRIWFCDADFAMAAIGAWVDYFLAHDPHLRKKIEPWFRANAPYTFKKLPSGEWQGVNRDYTPLGNAAFVVEPRAMKGIWHRVSNYLVSLYDDGRDSRRGYFSRLLKLGRDWVTLPAEKAPPH